MKQFRRIVALVLALVLLTGVLPSAIFAQEPETAPAGEAPEAPARASVQLGTDGLLDADTLILGSAQSGNKYYPLEWMVADADKDSIGRNGGALLVSKFLLPEAQTDSVSGGIDTAASYGSINVTDTKTASVTMPESYTVLYTTKNDKDYVANLGENVDGLYNKSDIKNTSYYVVGADTAEKRYSLTAAKFFELSAQELETYFPNDSSNSFTASTSMLARRPYAAGYAVEKSTDRVWALRGSDLNGNRVVVEAAKADNPITQDEYTAQAGGLVGEKGEQEALSRPAFNLRKNAITFLYKAEVNPDSSSSDSFGIIINKETPLQIAEEQKIDPTTTVTGSTVWRAALEALPMIHASVTYKQDGTLVIDFPETNANDYKVGVLEAAADGSILRWGTARLTTYDKITMKPEEDVSKLYFFTYTYDTNTCQMLTSNLVEVSAARPSAMTLGTTEVRDGDQILFPKTTAYVISADTGSTGMQNTGIIKNDGELNSTMTQGAGNKDQYPVKDDEAMFLAAKLPTWSIVWRMNGGLLVSPYVALGETISDAISSAKQSAPHIDNPGVREQLENNYNSTKSYVESNLQKLNDAKLKNTNMLGDGQDYCFSELFLENERPNDILKNAFAYTWINDDEYRVEVNDCPTIDPATALRAEHSVWGKQLFPLSAGEYVQAPQNVKEALSGISLRTVIEQKFDLCVENPLVVDSDPAATADGYVKTVASYLAPLEVVPAAGFNLKKESIAFMLQKSAMQDGTVNCNALNKMVYDPNCTQWNIALLDSTTQLQCEYPSRGTFVLTGFPAHRGSMWQDYISLMVTDSAGAVKQYGRVCDIETIVPFESKYSFTLDLSKLAYGDRVYAIYEYQEYGTKDDNKVICASEPLLIWENKLSGSLKITPDRYFEGETLAVDTSNLKFSAAEKVEYSWYRYGKTFYYETDNDTFTVNENTPDIYARLTFQGNNRKNYSSAYAKETTAFPVYPGTKDQDFFKGGRLFFGPKDDSSDYSWAIVGKATGVSSVSDNSGNRIFYTGLTADNALELLSTNAYEGGSGTSLNGYMSHTVVRTSTSDAAFTKGAISGLAGTASAQNVFAPAYTDYQKLSDSKTSLFAAFAGTSDAASYLLRNVSNRKIHASVDGWTDLQQKSNSLPTRDAINVNNKAIAFYSPAACDLTYTALKSCRQSNDGNWKLTVYDPKEFHFTNISAASVSGSTVSVSGTWDSYDELENLNVTVWAEKNGEITWLDSVPLENTGDFTKELTMPDGTSYDDVFAVLRVDNGSYRTDICSMPTPATPTEVKVEVYVNGRLTDTGCHYTIRKQGVVETKFNTGDVAVVNVTADTGFEITALEVFFSDGTSEERDISGYLIHGVPCMSESIAFNVKGITPTVRIDLSTVEYKIRTGVTTYDRNHALSSVPGGTINVQSGALKDETVNFTVNCKEGYLLFDLRVDGDPVYGSMIEIPTKDGGYIPAYKPGETYSFTMPAHDIRIEAEIWQIPGFELKLVTEPDGAGTLTAELPDGESLTDLLGGSEVKLNPTANDGWKLAGLTYKEGADGEELPFEADENGYEFIMPYSNVTVTAHYAKTHQITSEFMDISDPANHVKTAGAVKYTVNGEETTEFAAGDVVTATITCADNMKLVNILTTPETQVERTGTYTVTFTMPDEDLNVVYNFNKLQIRSAYLHVNQDINLIYSVQVPDGFENPTMEFTYLGETYTVKDYTVDASGRYCFEFTHITPQCMGETVDATVTAAKDGATYTHSVKNYSIRKYAQNMLNKSTDPLLITLLSDIMVYGEKSQLYTNYKTDELVSRDLPIQPSEFPGISGYRVWYVGKEDAATCWKSAGLVLSNNMSMQYQFYAENIEGLSAVVTVDGRSQTITDFQPVKGKTNVYSFTYRGIYATEFNATVSASFFRNGAQVGNTLNYSVNTYVYIAQDNVNVKLRDIVRAIYNYGVSAEIYYRERIMKNETVRDS